MSSSERSIPHLRDVFGLSGHSAQNHHHNNNLPNAVPSENGNLEYYSQAPDTKRHSRKKRDSNKTLTSGDVKTLERHLSMKKTIRKKIMRDLQQAFVEDPNEFKVENSNSEQLKAEIRAEALRFGEKPTKKSDNFLDMLRGEKNAHDHSSNCKQSKAGDYASTSTTSSSEKPSFWSRLTMKNKSKR